jgi:transcriptional regulator with GAF, ATPase, and Fis domain
MAIPGEDQRLDVARVPVVQPPGEPASDEPFPTLDEAMRRHIEAALIRCNGRIEGEHGAARLLAIHANTLRSRMHKLGIRWERFRDRGKVTGP